MNVLSICTLISTFIIHPLIHIHQKKIALKIAAKVCESKGPYRPDAIWQGDANFQFSITFNFNILLWFSNIRNHLSNFSYLVCISCKIFIG